MTCEIAAFYKFLPLPHFAELREPLKQLCLDHEVKGMILLAQEGINGTIAGPTQSMKIVLSGLRALPGLHDLECKTSYAPFMPFRRMKVRLKKEIVTIGLPEVDPLAITGTYVRAQDWNALISDPEVIVLDTRNDFEVKMGSFRGALNPQTVSFGDFPKFVEDHLGAARGRKIAMFCTGGIRCEKAGSYMRQQGFEQVYQLEGGILKYLETIPPETSLWQGACFVFDQRIGVDHHLEPIHQPVTDSPTEPLLTLP